MPRKRIPYSPNAKAALDPEHGQGSFTLMRDPVTRAPLFSPHPWKGHDVHDNPVHSKAAKESVVAMARKHTVEAMLTLVYHMRNPYDPELSAKCAEILIERGWGKTPQVVGLIDGTGEDGKPKLSVEERRKLLMASVEGHIASSVAGISDADAIPVTRTPDDAHADAIPVHADVRSHAEPAPSVLD